MKDATGRDIEVGAVVDILVDEMLHALVIEASDGGILDGGGQPQPAKLVLNIQIPITLNPGQLAPVYLIRAPKPKADKPKLDSKPSLKVM